MDDLLFILLMLGLWFGGVIALVKLAKYLIEDNSKK